MSARRVLVEFERRRAANHRYSLRAFARTLGVSHSVLSRICRGRTQASAATLRRLEARLGTSGLSASEALRDQRLEALLRLVRRPDVRLDVRWLAVRLGLTLDETQLTLHDALRRGRLVLLATSIWGISAHQEQR